MRNAAKKYANTLETVPPLEELTEVPGSAPDAASPAAVPTVSEQIHSSSGDSGVSPALSANIPESG